MVKKFRMLVWVDYGLFGTLNDLVQRDSEQDYVYVKYTPLNSFRQTTFPIPVHKDNIHHLFSTRDDKGIEKEWTVIYTDSPDSLFSNVIKSDMVKILNEQKEKNRNLQVQIASLKKELETAKSGVKKSLAEMESMRKTQRDTTPSPFGRPSFVSPYDDNNDYGGGY